MRLRSGLMNKKGTIFATIFALLFVPGAIPAFIAIKTAKFKKKRATKNKVKD